VKATEGIAVQQFDQTHRSSNSAPTTANRVWLRVACNFDTELAVFSWSPDGKRFTALGDPFTMAFQLTTFQGVRLALFNYNTAGKPGGYADFDDFKTDEPRARGIERVIPVNQTITLTSGADGSTLAAAPDGMALVNVPADSSHAPQQGHFRVVDLGKGRVGLKAADGRFVSAAGDSVSLKDLAGARPGEAESFQWINLRRGDTMLMSLVSHRYLATKPNNPGTVTVSALGPRPDRKDEACFKWNTVE